VGYTENQRLDRRTAAVYGDDVGLSAARARRAMQSVVEQMHLQPAQAEHEGRGYVQSGDVVNAGFTRASPPMSWCRWSTTNRPFSMTTRVWISRA